MADYGAPWRTTAGRRVRMARPIRPARLIRYRSRPAAAVFPMLTSPGGQGLVGAAETSAGVACDIERLLLLPPFAERRWSRRPPRNSASFSAIRRRARPQAFRAPGNRDPSRRLIRQEIRETIRRRAAILRLRGGDRGAQSTRVRCRRRELLRLNRCPVHGRRNPAGRRPPPMHRHNRATKWSPSPPRRL